MNFFFELNLAILNAEELLQKWHQVSLIDSYYLVDGLAGCMYECSFSFVTFSPPAGPFEFHNAERFVILTGFEIVALIYNVAFCKLFTLPLGVILIVLYLINNIMRNIK